MHIKLITCGVNTNKIQAFSKAQEKWKHTAKSDGFIVQFGGWNENNKNEAIIVAIWENKTYLDYFMEKVHDTIVNSNNQADTYNSISINHFSSNENDSKHFIETIKMIAYLSLSDCNSNDKVDNSELAQLDEVSFNFKNNHTLDISIRNNQKKFKKESGKTLNKTIKLLDIWSVFPLSNN